MCNKKRILIFMVALFMLIVVSGCGSQDSQAKKSAPPATAAKSVGSMPNEDPMPIAQDLERKLKDTGTMVKEGKLAEAKLIVAEALKTNERLIVHITNPQLQESLRKGISDVNSAVSASPADQKNAGAKVAAALEVVKQAAVQLQGHTH